MHISKVELKDIKSYAKSGPIWFAQGVNAISGPTGAGKSTILEAIGFALFDALPYAQRKFVREGAKRGEVVVSFIDALDDREYQVVRPVSGGSLYVYDPEIQRRIVTGKGDVVDWLKEHLGVDQTADLSALFTDAVGVPQGLLTAAFRERPRDRKHKFDPLLQVDDYELAWERLRETAGYLKQQLAVQERRIAELRAELKRLPQLENETRELRERIAADEQRLAEVVTLLEQVETEKATLDTARHHIDEVTRQLEGLTGHLEGLGQQLYSAEAEAQKAQEAQQIVEETEEGYRLYEEAREKLSRLEEQRKTRDRLNGQLEQIERAVALAEREVKGLEQTLEEIAEAEKRVAELEPLVTEQLQLEKELKAAERNADRLIEAQERVTEEQAKSEKLEADLRRVQEQLETLQVIEAEIEEREQQCGELEKQIAALEAEQEQIKDLRQQLEERLALLEQEEAAQCPVCLRPLEAEQAEALNEHYQDELSQLGRRVKGIRRGLRKGRKELKAAKGRRGELREQAKSLPRPDRETELAQEIKAQRRAVKRWQKKETTLANAPDQVRVLEKQLEELGDPRSEVQRIKVEADKRSGKETELTAASDEHARQTGAKQGVAEKLRAFANLDDDMAVQRKVMSSSQGDHSRYLEHRRIAETLPQRRAKVQELQTERDQVQTQQKETEAELKETRAGYDEAKHNELVEDYQGLTKEQTRLDERLKSGEERLSRVQTELAALQQLQIELRKVEQEWESLCALSDALEFIRKTVREAGPYVTRELVRTISAQADRIFGDILDDHSMCLHWGEDYGITIVQLGNERDFSQLSGGEKMAAALAVRLALLHEMSDIRIAFFDEPTAHLDNERRENLAAQITEIKGFHQLFVISHDDTFERETHHVLRVSKENGVSQVEVG